MSIEIIIALISAGIAFTTSVTNFIYSVIQNRKDRTQRVILENRIKYMNEIREGYSSFISLANLASIEYAKSNHEVMKTYSASLFNGYGKIKTYLKPFYKIEKELLTTLDDLYYCVLSVINGEEKNRNSIDDLRENFADKFLKYDWAYWKYIQCQKEGNHLNSDDAFDKVYYDLVEKINKNLL